MAREQYTLRYESKYLMELGKAMDYIMGFAVSVAIQQTLMETALAGDLSEIPQDTGYLIIVAFKVWSQQFLGRLPFFPALLYWTTHGMCV